MCHKLCAYHPQLHVLWLNSGFTDLQGCLSQQQTGQGPEGTNSENKESPMAGSVESLREEIAAIKDAGQKSIDQAISLMDQAVFKMREELSVKVDETVMNQMFEEHMVCVSADLTVALVPVPSSRRRSPGFAESTGATTSH